MSSPSPAERRLVLCLSRRQLPTISLTAAKPAARTSLEEGPFLACFFILGGRG